MATLKGLSQFKSKLIGGGARPNLFEVTIPSFPGGVNFDLLIGRLISLEAIFFSINRTAHWKHFLINSSVGIDLGGEKHTILLFSFKFFKNLCNLK